MIKPFSQACENNKKPILAILENTFANTAQVIEIGSGSGQHATYFGKNLPHLNWQTSDLAVNHQGINLWLDESQLPNVQRPIELDLNKSWLLPSDLKKTEGIFTANTLHIISWPLVIKFFTGVSQNLKLNGTLCIYGPFNYQGKFTSESNAQFDLWLKDRDIKSGIRDFEAIKTLAESLGLHFIADNVMPANNRLLVFKQNSGE